MVIHGAESDVLLTDTADQMVIMETCPDVAGERELFRVPGVGHAPGLVNKPQMDAIERFLLKHVGSTDIPTVPQTRTASSATSSGAGAGAGAGAGSGVAPSATPSDS